MQLRSPAPGDRLPCVSYAPYHRPGQSPLVKGTIVSRSQIDADLAQIARSFRCVRTYSIDQGLAEVPALARKHGLRVLLGLWIGPEAQENERAWIARELHDDALAAGLAHAGVLHLDVELALRRRSRAEPRDPSRGRLRARPAPGASRPTVRGRPLRALVCPSVRGRGPGELLNEEQWRPA